MEEPALARTLFVRRIEDEDDMGELVSREVRREASRAEGGAELLRERRREGGLSVGERGFLGGRAGRVLVGLGEGVPDVPAGRWLGVAGLGLVLVALVLGFGANQLANARLFNVLSPPFVGILLWNLLVFAMLAGRVVIFRRGSAGGGVGVAGRWLARLGMGRLGVSAEGAGPLGRARAGHAAEWGKLLFPALARRAGMWFHLAAAGFAIGAVSGLYLTGLVEEYRAVWESTFLGEAERERIVRVLYGPASRVSGIPLSGFAELGKPGEGGGLPGAPAARWIHLCAVTLGIFVVLPRLLLAFSSCLSAGRVWRGSVRGAWAGLRPYLGALLDGLAGSGKKVAVLPYGSGPAGGGMAGVRDGAEEIWGGGVDLGILPPVEYGAEDEILNGGVDSPDVLLVFPLTSTPEMELHGRLAAGLREARAGGGGRVAAVLDAAAFCRRFSALPEFESRLEERVAAWEAMLARAGIDEVVTGGAAVSEGGILSTVDK